ncbi:biotin transporter BioY [candidate division KSB1 bacterium]|nr:biotin transporter BioY [candidate division KSB1 bacterium]
MSGSLKNSRQLLFSGLFIALTTLGGFIRIPFFPVPLTFQTLFVYLSGTLLGSRHGVLCQVLFIILGLAGLPLFTTGGGLRTVLQPTFGYLLGFPLAAGLIGYLTHRSKTEMNVRTLVPALTMGCLVIFTLGIVYLAVYTKWIVGHPMSWINMFWAGFIIFIPAEILKIALAYTLTLKLRPLLKRG